MKKSIFFVFLFLIPLSGKGDVFFCLNIWRKCCTLQSFFRFLAQGKENSKIQHKCHKKRGDNLCNMNVSTDCNIVECYK